MSSTPSELIVSVHRTGLLWAWTLRHECDGEVVRIIGAGTTWRRRSAIEAAAAWSRIWVRRYGPY